MPGAKKNRRPSNLDCGRGGSPLHAHWRQLKEQALAALREVGGVPTGDRGLALPNTLNIAIPGLDSEAVMLALKELVAIANGSACTSQNYTASHVLRAMGLPEDHIKGALRLSWCHLTPEVRWREVVERIEGLKWGHASNRLAAGARNNRYTTSSPAGA